ncbi:MAG: hypothetical protein IKY34_06175 [Ruminiclostridium sp.]|nr:hypothetical protein [Ruminiclostridium sp.]
MTNFRFFTAAGLFFGLLLCFSALLWNLQVVNGAAYYERSQQAIARTETVPAARGKLLDRTGKILAQDMVSWVIQVSGDCPEPDLQRLEALCREEGVDWSGAGDIADPTPELLVRVRSEDLTRVTIGSAVTRQGSGDLAPHIIGRVGKMTPDQWEDYRDQGYPMDAMVGQDGAEAAFEALLHGTDGTKVIHTDRQGEVTGEGYGVQPKPGQDVTLTLDRDLQETLQTALGDYLAAHGCPGGAGVMLDVTDGGVLAMASLPGYDTATFSADYARLTADPAAPLMNRAIQGLYAPGSTFKLVTAAAALEEGVLTPETRILDTGRYTYYPSPQPQCWLYRQEGRTHGLETLTEALTDSCNIFFYDAGRRVGIDTLGTWAEQLGLGMSTGVELAGEKTGVVAGPDYTRSVGGTWYEGSVLSAAIGQENNRFTPLQLAHMTATLVGDGNRWQVHLLKKVGGEDYTPVSLGKVDIAPENLTAIKEGMLGVTQTGSLASAFRDLPVRAGAKTGSAQVAADRASNAVLVAFAPYEDPQVALALVAQEGGSGSALGEVAAAILKTYFEKI